MAFYTFINLLRSDMALLGKRNCANFCGNPDMALKREETVRSFVETKIGIVTRINIAKFCGNPGMALLRGETVRSFVKTLIWQCYEVKLNCANFFGNPEMGWHMLREVTVRSFGSSLDKALPSE
jgi:hypothetical protein